jgi:hypothetical protein
MNCCVARTLACDVCDLLLVVDVQAETYRAEEGEREDRKDQGELGESLSPRTTHEQNHQ